MSQHFINSSFLLSGVRQLHRQLITEQINPKTKFKYLTNLIPTIKRVVNQQNFTVRKQEMT